MSGPLRAIQEWGRATAQAYADGMSGKSRPPYCSTPGCTATDEKSHRPDAHVAEAYHYESAGRCASDGEKWPCLTHREYGR